MRGFVEIWQSAYFHQRKWGLAKSINSEEVLQNIGVTGDYRRSFQTKWQIEGQIISLIGGTRG